jgi:hypothetical protein
MRVVCTGGCRNPLAADPVAHLKHCPVYVAEYSSCPRCKRPYDEAKPYLASLNKIPPSSNPD